MLPSLRTGSLLAALLCAASFAHAAPANDDCAGAIELTKDVAATGDTSTATASGVPGCGTTDTIDVWYRYTPAVDESVSFSLCNADFDTSLAVFDGCYGALLACNDQSAVCGNPDASSIECIFLEGGRNYLIRIAGNAASTGNYELITTACAPQNDDCENARPIFEDQTLTGTTEAATDSGTGGCTGTEPYDVWYRFVPPVTGSADFSICAAPFDTTLGIFDGCGGTLIACNDDNGICAERSSLVGCLPVTANSEYLIRVAGYGETKGEFNLTVTMNACTAPPNDACADALPLPEDVLVTGNSYGATGTTTSSCSLNDFYDVWYDFTPANDGIVDIGTCGSTMDTTLSIYDTCGGSELACSDDDCQFQSVIENFAVTGGTSYKVRVAGYSGDTGDFVLLATTAGAPVSTFIKSNAPSPTNASSLDFIVRFNQPVVGFNDAADLIFVETGVAHTGVTITGGPTNYTVTVTGITGDGTLRLTASTNSDVTNAALVPLHYAPISPVVTIDTTPPTLSLDTTTADPATGPILVTMTSSEVLPGVTPAMLNLNNAIVYNLTGSGTQFQFVLSPLSVGLFGVSVDAGAVADLAGNLNVDSASLTRTYVADGPGALLSSSSGPQVNGPVQIDITLTQPTYTFTIDDLETTNGTVTAFGGSGAEYVITLAPTVEGPFSAQIPAGAFTDPLGIPNQTSNLFARTYDTTLPTFSAITISPPQASVDETVHITFTASEPLLEAPSVFVGSAMAMPAGKSAYDYVYTVSPSDSVGLLPVVVTGVDLAGNLGTSLTPASLEVVAPPAEVPLASWPALLGLTLAGVAVSRRRRA